MKNYYDTLYEKYPLFKMNHEIYIKYIKYIKTENFIVFNDFLKTDDFIMLKQIYLRKKKLKEIITNT